VALRRLRPLAALLVVLLAALSAGGAAGSARTPSYPSTTRALLAAPHGTLDVARLARSSTTWRGGPVTTSTGETVRVFVSDSLPAEAVTPEERAEFLASLTHGPELSLLTAYFATLEEVQEVCGRRALGCYGRNQMFVPGTDEGLALTGATADEVVRHEYGHHVAFHRSNTPWLALDWGPKRWASAVDVCARVARNEAYPGNQGTNYRLNPGEAWAETYRLMDERRAGITTATWSIVAPSFYPGEPALQAAEADVLDPWTAPRGVSYRRTFGRSTRKVWLIPIATPLDGTLRATVTLPRNGTHEVTLLTASRKTVLARATRSSPRVRQLTATVCGQRSVVLRVVQRGALGPVAVSVSVP
jgi:hypothetical protein